MGCLKIKGGQKIYILTYIMTFRTEYRERLKMKKVHIFAKDVIKKERAYFLVHPYSGKISIFLQSIYSLKKLASSLHFRRKCRMLISNSYACYLNLYIFSALLECMF